jgi:DNA-binding response OmpR family regulator
VLVVEDERVLARNLAEGLRDAGLAVDLAYDGAGALDKLDLVDYDVVVLDRDLPGVHGDDVCRRLSERDAPCRVLMLTAAAGVEERVAGLSLGADDYLQKPFAFAELVARIRALSRRRPSAPPVLSRGDLTADLARRTVTRAGRPISLTRKEFGILEALLLADGAVLSAEELLDRVWDEHLDPFSNIVQVTVGRLRRKLGDPQLIHTVVGTGYRL